MGSAFLGFYSVSGLFLSSSVHTGNRSIKARATVVLILNVRTEWLFAREVIFRFSE